MGDEKALNASIRLAKKASRPSKIGEPERRVNKGKSRDKKSGRVKRTARIGGAFESDIGQRSGRGEGVRAKKGDAIGGLGKKGGQRGKRKGK